LSWGYSFPVAASLSRNPDRPAHREARAFCERSRPRLVFLPRRSPPSSHASFQHGSANRACFRLIMSWTKDGPGTRRFLPNSSLLYTTAFRQITVLRYRRCAAVDVLRFSSLGRNFDLDQLLCTRPSQLVV